LNKRFSLPLVRFAKERLQKEMSALCMSIHKLAIKQKASTGVIKGFQGLTRLEVRNPIDIQCCYWFFVVISLQSHRLKSLLEIACF
jgi:hypothetical protein